MHVERKNIKSLDYLKRMCKRVESPEQQCKGIAVSWLIKKGWDPVV